MGIKGRASNLKTLYSAKSACSYSLIISVGSSEFQEYGNSPSQSRDYLVAKGEYQLLLIMQDRKQLKDILDYSASESDSDNDSLDRSAADQDSEAFGGETGGRSTLANN